MWHEGRHSLFWVDISANRLYEKPLLGEEEYCWYLPETVSSIAGDSHSDDVVWLISERNLVCFTLSSGRYEPMLRLPIDGNFRSNDGAVAPDGRYWFGTMLRKPQPTKGQVYSIGKAGDLRLELSAIAIPNSFCWLDSYNVLISDSIEKICRHYRMGNSGAIQGTRNLIDLRHSPATPDGAAVDKQGNVWVALWGGYKVVCYDPNGTPAAEIHLSVPQPSSCCFGGPDNNILFITSARDGLTSAQLSQYPESGSVFFIQLPAQGAEVHQFSLETQC